MPLVNRKGLIERERGEGKGGGAHMDAIIKLSSKEMEKGSG